MSNIFSLLNKELFSYLKIGKLPNIRISVPLGSIPSRERSHKLQRPSRQISSSNLLEMIESPLSISQRKHSNASKFQYLIDNLELEKYIHQNKLKNSSNNNINSNSNNNKNNSDNNKGNNKANDKDIITNNVNNKNNITDNQSNNQSTSEKEIQSERQQSSNIEEDTNISISVISYTESNSILCEVDDNFDVEEDTNDNMEINFDKFSQFLRPHYKKALMLFGVVAHCIGCITQSTQN